VNDELSGLEQMLEQATAPKDAPPRDLGPEAQPLRETWLAFGRLLDSAERSAAAAKAEVRLPPASRRWPLAAAAVLAASLLIGLSVFWMQSGADSNTGQVVSAQPAKNVEKAAAASTTGDLLWDDSFDQQIASAGQGMALAQSDLAHASDATDFVRFQLHQTEQDFEKTKL
jgi:hypothetical protein